MSEPGTPASSRLGLLSLALIGLLIVLLVLGVLLGLKWKHAKGKQDGYADAIAAAKAETQAFTTLDYRSAKKSLKRVQDGATGQFGQEFSKQSPTIIKLTAQNESVSKGTIVSAGVVSMDEDSARVIVVADSKVTNKSTRKPVPRHYRLQLDLVKEKGEWLTSALEFR